MDLNDLPRSSDETVPVPYTNWFVAQQGSGPNFDQWGRVMLEARVTAKTRPVPTARLVRQAMLDKKQVAVTTVCRGSTFEVASIKLAG